MPADQHRLGRGLEQHRVAGGQRRQHAAGRDGQREVPGRRDDHHAQRVEPVALHGVARSEGARVVAGEVHRLGDLRIGLRHRLGAVHDHGADQVAAPAGEHGRRPVEQTAPLRRGPGGPRRLPLARGVERAAHLRAVRQRVAIGHARRIGPVVGIHRPGARDQFARDLQRHALRCALPPPRAHALDPLAIGAERPVRVGLAGERRLEVTRRRLRGGLGVAILRPPRRIGQPVHERERGEEPVALEVPLRRARLEPEDVAQEVVGRGVLVQASDQVRDGAVEVLRAHHRGVEQESARARLHRARLVVGHALEHLELHPGRDVPLLAERQPVGHVEEVVAGDPEVHRPRMLGPAAVLDHPLEAGVHVGLARERSLGPAVQVGLDPLHRQVRALDHAQLDWRPAARGPRQRPVHERALHAVRLRQVGLQHDARGQEAELRLVQHLAEGGDGEVEVAVFLHVQVDELRGDAAVRVPVAVPPGLAVQLAQPRLHDLDAWPERREIELARDRGDLDRDVLDVLAGQERQVRLEPARRLLLAQDGLTQLVQVEPDGVRAPRG